MTGPSDVTRARRMFLENPSTNLQVLVRNRYTWMNDFIGPDVKQKTTEADLNYIIKQFNARVSVFYIDQKYSNNAGERKQFGVGLQVQL